jgi:predicted transcriptional regulator
MSKFKYDSYKKNMKRDLHCPVCHTFEGTSYSNLARHLASEGNNRPGDAHREWRLKNRFPADYMIPDEAEVISSKIMDKMGWG